MASIEWGPQLEVGVSVIDKQHKHWVELYNALDDAAKAGKGKELIGQTLQDLVDYSHSHFRTEEALMERAGYDEIAEHKQEHKKFAAQMQMYQDRYLQGFNDMDENVRGDLREWLVNHITATDRGYIPSLKEAGIE